jgi:hypothetical protein
MKAMGSGQRRLGSCSTDKNIRPDYFVHSRLALAPAPALTKFKIGRYSEEYILRVKPDALQSDQA